MGEMPSMKHIKHYTKTILLIMLFVIAVPTMAQKSGKKPFTVVIDAGHGGVDPGALGRKSQEKNINFKVSNRVGQLIKEAYPEVKIIYTRTTDVKIPLAKRADTRLRLRLPKSQWKKELMMKWKNFLQRKTLAWRI